MQLILFTRQGCCLCAGLAEKLRALEPPPALETRDVDADPSLAARYGQEVPVLAIAAAGAAPDGWRELPRVPPRLAGESLMIWLQKHGSPLSSA